MKNANVRTYTLRRFSRQYDLPAYVIENAILSGALPFKICAGRLELKDEDVASLDFAPFYGRKIKAEEFLTIEKFDAWLEAKFLENPLSHVGTNYVPPICVFAAETLPWMKHLSYATSSKVHLASRYLIFDRPFTLMRVRIEPWMNQTSIEPIRPNGELCAAEVLNVWRWLRNVYAPGKPR